MQLYFKSDSRIKENKRTKTTFTVRLMFSCIVPVSLHLIFMCAFKLTSSMLSLQPEEFSSRVCLLAINSFYLGMS